MATMPIESDRVHKIGGLTVAGKRVLLVVMSIGFLTVIAGAKPIEAQAGLGCGIGQETIKATDVGGAATYGDKVLLVDAASESCAIGTADAITGCFQSNQYEGTVPLLGIPNGQPDDATWSGDVGCQTGGAATGNTATFASSGWSDTLRAIGCPPVQEWWRGHYTANDVWFNQYSEPDTLYVLTPACPIGT